MSNWIIAAATVINVIVYFLLWRESRRQNAVTRASLELTRNAFLESLKPVLSVSVERCEYFGDKVQEFSGEIVIDNCGGATAVEVNIWLRFNAGTLPEAAENIASIAIHPHIPYRASFTFPMGPQVLKLAHSKGNPLGMRADGSYKGIDGRIYTYSELRYYDTKLHRFVPIHTG